MRQRQEGGLTPATTTTTRPSTTAYVDDPDHEPPRRPRPSVTTTTPTCPNTGSTDPRSTTAAQPAALLTKVAVTNVDCRDSVTFTFKKSGSAVPSCKVEYRPGPFSQDGSGAPVTVAGSAFVVVRCEPAYGYDFENGTTTYTGPKRITPAGTRHVREVVETGDFEGVLNWVIGLDAASVRDHRGRGADPSADHHVLLRQSRMTLPNVVSDFTSS